MLPQPPGRVRATGLSLSLVAALACHPGAPCATAPIPMARVEPDTTSEQDVITEGRRIFHGVGLCYACHGGRLQGGPVAPALAGPARRLDDTSFAHILHVIRAGTPHTPMIASQGGIDDGQMLQVANYVWAVASGRSVP